MSPPRLTASVDLVICASMTAVTTMLAVFGPSFHSPIRVVFGLGFALFVPGFASSRALGFSVPGLERITLSLALSVVMLTGATLVLNETRFGLTPSSIGIALGTFTTAALGFAWRRDGWRARPESNPSRTVLVCAVAGLLAVAAFAWISDTRQPLEPSSTLVLLGPTGRFEGYADRVEPGEIVRFRLEITNLEGRSARYRILAGFEKVAAVAAPVVPSGATVRVPLVLRAPLSPGRHRLDVRLLLDDAPRTAEPYRRATAFVVVKKRAP